MKEIKLSQGKVALVDDEDFDYLNQWRWFAHKDHRTFYVGRSINVDGKQRQIWMHRIIMHTTSDMQVDHIDHNGLNNQKNNLRNCTHKENSKNKISNCKLNYLGVSYYLAPKNKKKPYRATICHDGKNFHLGCFATIEEAALAYNEAALKYHGEFANLNKI